MKNVSLVSLLLLSACFGVPNTQPVIDGTLAWKKAEDSELAKHRQLALLAIFDNNPVKNAEMKSQYLSIIDTHARSADNFANAIVSWAQRVGQFDEEYANKTLDQMIDLYIKVKVATNDK